MEAGEANIEWASIALSRPGDAVVSRDPPPIERHDLLGGLIHEYEIAA
jgi:hypothetical protein